LRGYSKMCERICYNIHLLDSYRTEHNIEFICDYSTCDINKKTVIRSKCLTQNCKNETEKRFGVLYKTGSYCSKCTINNGKIKKEKTNIEKFGTKNPFQSEDIKNKIRESMINKHGVEYPSQSTEIRQKSIERWKTNLGVENPSQSTEIKTKKENTTLANYGVKYTLQSDELRSQINVTMKDKYGVEHPMHSDEIKNKLRKTNMKRYGVENPMQRCYPTGKYYYRKKVINLEKMDPKPT